MTERSRRFRAAGPLSARVACGDVYTLEKPAAALAPYIEHYWFVVAPPGHPFDLRVEVFADARADLVFNMGAAYTRDAEGQRATIRRSNLDAQRVHPITIRQRGSVVVAGARFHTAGLGAFVPSVQAWTNHVVPIAAAFGDEILELERALRLHIGQPKPQSALLDAFFASRLDVTSSKSTVLAIKSRIEEERGAIRIEDLCKGISIRQVDRLFRQHVGVSPKTFAQIARFQSAIEMLKGDPKCTLADVAARCGYYDQSHFVKECRRFSGDAPKQKRGYFPPGAPADFSPNVVQFFPGSEVR